MPSKLPERLIVEGLSLAKEATYYGIPLDELSPEELKACLALACKAHMDSLARRSGVGEFIASLRGNHA